MAVREADLSEQLAGLDALEIAPASELSVPQRLWAATWPKVGAVAIAVLVWQIVVWLRWRPEYVLSPPARVADALVTLLRSGDFWDAVGTTAQRAALGYAIALVIGGAIGSAVATVSVLRVALGALITGLQTMPSIAWFPLSILLFQLSESAILFVVVLGAAPSVANGLISGVDNVPPLLLRAGRTLGASKLTLFRLVTVPAALPAAVAGLKQGWAFAWRSLMAGELLVIIASRPSIGARLQFARELSDAEGLMAMMIVVLAIGVIVDGIFTQVERRIRWRRGLL